MAIRRLVIGPGAMAYFGFLGALSALYDSGALNELEAISGSSAGSLLGFVYILAKGDIRRIFEYSLKVPTKTIMKPNIRTFLKSFGLVNSSKIRKTFEGTVREFLGKSDVTFKELYEHHPIKLYVSACCVNLSKTHYFSVDATPDMSVVDAICMSIAVPFLIETVEYGPWRYIDGGALEETPCLPFIGQDHVHVLCVDDFASDFHIPDFKTYIQTILWSVMKLRHTYPQFPRTALTLDSNAIFDFGASESSKMKLFLDGYNKV